MPCTWVQTCLNLFSFNHTRGNMSTTAAPEKREFQAETRQILDLVIHSLYSNKDIFLRELISNASDALDKARIESLQNIDVLGDDKQFQIRISTDTENRTVTISDNGIGMTREELVSNIGTIARSGTKEFLKKLSGDQKKDLSLIGQFGVGFYSAFMVAEKVTLTTKRMGASEPAQRWESTGDGTYTVEDADKESRGTIIVVTLKEDDKEYADEWKVRNIAKKYNGFVSHPIVLEVADEKDKEKKKDEVLNDKPPLWRRSKVDIKDEEYKEFYKHLAFDQEDPLLWTHNKVEGTLEYTSLMYIPSKAPYDLFMPEKTNGLSLYVKRIFIMNDCKELLPTYLRFVKGVVDSEDLPLNVSREILQQNSVLNKIQKSSTKKVLSLLEDLARKNPDDYKKFWKEFGMVMKEGFHMNWDHLEELKNLVRFSSNKSKDENDYRSLEDYVKDMKEGQKEIYYITGESYNAVKASPHLEALVAKGLEVLFMVDPIDEWVSQSLSEYQEKKLKNITKGELDLGDLSKEEKETQKEGKSKFKNLMDAIKDFFPEQLKEVRVTTRLKDSPACLVADDHGMTANMERIMKMANQKTEASKRILEINPSHPILENMLKRYEENASNPKIKEWSSVIFDQALLAEGSQLREPQEFVKRINGLLQDVSAKA